MELDNNRKVEIIIGLFLLGGIITWLVIPMSFQDTTIILEGGGGGAPISCLPNGGFVLSQNLTDLCDVVIENPVNQEVLKYNGTYWTNQNETISGVTSVTSNSNNTIGVIPTTGDIVLYPKYELLCQSKLTSNNASLACGNFTTKEHIRVQAYIVISSNGTSIVSAWRFNADTGTNYSWRNSFNGGADVTSLSTGSCRLNANNVIANNGGGIQTMDIMNIQSLRKVGYGTSVLTIDSDATGVPTRAETGCKWSNTSTQIDRVDLVILSGTAVYASGTSISVWGYD